MPEERTLTTDNAIDARLPEDWGLNLKNAAKSKAHTVDFVPARFSERENPHTPSAHDDEEAQYGWFTVGWWALAGVGLLLGEVVVIGAWAVTIEARPSLRVWLRAPFGLGNHEYAVLTTEAAEAFTKRVKEILVSECTLSTLLGLALGSFVATADGAPGSIRGRRCISDIGKIK